MTRLWDAGVVAVIVALVLVGSAMVGGSLQIEHLDGLRPDSRAMIVVHHAFNALWLVCSPLGFFALRFARSLRADRGLG